MSEDLPQDSPVYSPIDAVSAYLSPALRVLGDFQHDLTGSHSSVIHIKNATVDAWEGNSGRDIFGKIDERLDLSVIHNTIIKYPGIGKLWVFQSNQGQSTVTSSLTPEENLPIEMFLRFTGDYNSTPVALQKNDVVVDYFIDENQHFIPLFLQITQIFASFNSKNVVRKTANLAPYRGKFPKSINEAVTLFLANLPKPPTF